MLRRFILRLSLACAAVMPSCPRPAFAQADAAVAKPADPNALAEAFKGPGVIDLPQGDLGPVVRPIMLGTKQQLVGRGSGATALVMHPNFVGPCIVAGIEPRDFDPVARTGKPLANGCARSYRTGANSLLSFPNIQPKGGKLSIALAIREPGGISTGPVFGIGEHNAGPLFLFATAKNRVRVKVRTDAPAEYWPGSPFRFLDLKLDDAAAELHVLRIQVDLGSNRWAAWDGQVKAGSGSLTPVHVEGQPDLPPPAATAQFKTSWYPLVIGGAGNTATRSSEPLADRTIDGLKITSECPWAWDAATPSRADGSGIVGNLADAQDLAGISPDCLFSLASRPIVSGRLVPYYCGDFNYGYGYWLDADSDGKPAAQGVTQTGGMTLVMGCGAKGFTVRGKFGSPGDRRGVGLATGPCIDFRGEDLGFENLYDGISTLSVGAQWYATFRDCTWTYSGATFTDSITRLENCHFRLRHGSALRSIGSLLVARGLVLDGSPGPTPGALIDLRAGNYEYGTDLGDDVFWDQEGATGAEYLVSAENHPYMRTYLKLAGGQLGSPRVALALLKGRPGQLSLNAKATLRYDSAWSKFDLYRCEGAPAWNVVE